LSPQIEAAAEPAGGRVLDAVPGRDQGRRHHWARSWTYPSAASSVPRCRHAVLASLTAHGVQGEAADHAALLVTELAGNAVEHGAGGAGGVAVAKFTVVLGRRAGWLRIEVRDTGRILPGGPRPCPAVPECTATAGRGLFLVQTLSASWGVRPAGGGKAVWCTLAC
jgi:anti-sigma regulatory factor (Ser/Thr protein kinase)